MQILFVDGCIRGSASRTRRLADSFLNALCKRRPDTEITVVDLDALRLQPLCSDTLAARENAAGSWELDCFSLARQFQQADLVVFAAPFWEGTFPAALHTYLEHICVIGLTFHYDENGQPVGQCRANRAVFFSTRGGIYSEGPAKADDHAEAFLGSILRMLGISRLDTVTAEGLDIIGADLDALLQTAQEKSVALAQTI